MSSDSSFEGFWEFLLHVLIPSNRVMSSDQDLIKELEDYMEVLIPSNRVMSSDDNMYDPEIPAFSSLNPLKSGHVFGYLIQDILPLVVDKS